VIVEGGLEVGDKPDAVPRARRFVADAMSEVPCPALRADAELVVSELVTNAILHGAAPVALRVAPRPGGIRIEVRDAARTAPVRALVNADAMTGRGIALVERLARRWGVEPVARGKVVWAEILSEDCGALRPGPAREVEVDALLSSWGDGGFDDEPAADPRFTIRLGDVPTDLLIAAKAHVDNIAREFHLAAQGAASGTGKALHGPLAELVHTVVHRFTDARASIKRQAVAAVGRGDDRTELILTLPASSADAGEAYLAALDEADEWARAARLLTLETPPQHRAFRRWYVESLVAQLRAAAAGTPLPPPQTFEARLLDELSIVSIAQRATDRAARLQAVTAALAGARTADEVATVVVTEGLAALGANGCGLLVARADDRLGLVDSVGYDDALIDRLEHEHRNAPLPAAAVLRDGVPLWLESPRDLDERFPTLREMEPQTTAMCALPLLAGEEVLGVLRFSFGAPRLFDGDERRFMEAFAGQTAQALDRARALEEAGKASAQLAFLADASAVLSSTLDYRETLANIAQLVVPRFADWCAVELVDGGGLLTTVAIAHVDPVKIDYVAELRRRFPPDPEAPFGVPKVARSGVSELYADIPQNRIVAGDDEEERERITAKLGFRSAVIVPLTGRTGTLGTVTMVQAESGRRFDAGDLAIAEDVARRAAIAVENAREHGEQTGRLAAITRVAEAVQQAILAPVPERLGPVALAATYVSATEDALVGGDLYETVTRPGAVRLLIGDVRGKGLEAVRLATIVLGGFRGAAIECDDLTALGQRMDARLRPYLTEEDFVTALVAEIRDDGTCELITCGHPPALLSRDGNTVPVELVASPPLGLGIGGSPVPTRLKLEPGDRLLMYTDGLIEARDRQGRFAELGDLVSTLGQTPLPEVLGEILARLRSTVGAELGDDLALLVAEYRG
jgi:serine phosphatase RsbU (regulator of sigma subunit)/anti-sigma regulatory factor (Ser/Thr protein kinase)